MQTFYSTGGKAPQADIATAVLQSLAPDGGLYLPEKDIRMDEDFIASFQKLDFPTLAAKLSARFWGEDFMPLEQWQLICEEAFNFPLPIVKVKNKAFVLELFHGPSAAFKDFGARYMARLMPLLRKDDHRPLEVLVATSGDTGGAVAMGFLGVPQVRVTILYPAGKVSDLQELQLTSLGQNIRTLRVDGSFDDCQALVKKAFLDPRLNDTLCLTSANSINIGRLLPQSFYYWWLMGQLTKVLNPEDLSQLTIIVPSGNFGHIFGGLLAQRMGLKIPQLVAATNANDTFPKFLATGVYAPKPSVATISNAMDVGKPSNFERLFHWLGASAEGVRETLAGFSFSDAETLQVQERVFNETAYVLEPHTAVGWLAAEQFQQEGKPTVVFGTAHPAKFLDVIPQALQPAVSMSPSLSALIGREKQFTSIPNNFSALQQVLLR